MSTNPPKTGDGKGKGKGKMPTDAERGTTHRPVTPNPNRGSSDRNIEDVPDTLSFRKPIKIGQEKYSMEHTEAERELQKRMPADTPEMRKRAAQAEQVVRAERVAQAEEALQALKKESEYANKAASKKVEDAKKVLKEAQKALEDAQKAQGFF